MSAFRARLTLAACSVAGLAAVSACGLFNDEPTATDPPSPVATTATPSTSHGSGGADGAPSPSPTSAATRHYPAAATTLPGGAKGPAALPALAHTPYILGHRVRVGGYVYSYQLRDDPSQIWSARGGAVVAVQSPTDDRLDFLGADGRAITLSGATADNTMVNRQGSRVVTRYAASTYSRPRLAVYSLPDGLRRTVSPILKHGNRIEVEAFDGLTVTLTENHGHGHWRTREWDYTQSAFGRPAVLSVGTLAPWQRVLDTNEYHGVLSPDGRLVGAHLFMDSKLAVVRATTGDVLVSTSLPRRLRSQAADLRWLDDDTLLIVAWADRRGEPDDRLASLDVRTGRLTLSKPLHDRLAIAPSNPAPAHG